MKVKKEGEVVKKNLECRNGEQVPPFLGIVLVGY